MKLQNETGKPKVLFLHGVEGTNAVMQADMICQEKPNFKHINIKQLADDAQGKCCICRTHAGDEIHHARNPGNCTKNKEVVPDPGPAYADL